MTQFVAAVVLILSVIAVGILTLKLIDSAMKRVAKIVPTDDDAHRTRIVHRAETLRHFVRSVGKTILGVTVLFLIVVEAGYEDAWRSVLGTAAIAGLAIGFGAQSLVKDVIAGFFVLLEGQYGVGETIRVGNLEGVVEDMTLRVTVLRSGEGEVHVIPNGSIQAVTVLSRDWRRAVVDVEVSSKEDLSRVLTVLGRISEGLARDMSGRVTEKPTIVGIQRITGASVTIRLAAKTLPTEQAPVTHEWRRRIKETFDKEGIRLAESPAGFLQSSPLAG
jgi:small conductance mechanosensitive channel